MAIREGLVVKAISGFYYVKYENEVYECKPRGVFRNDGENPLVGDKVNFDFDNNKKGTISNILSRKNELLRPPISNLDKLFIVVSTITPSPNLLVLDKILTLCEYKGILPIIVITKIDIKSSSYIKKIYSTAGFKVIEISNINDADFHDVKLELKDSISAFTGNTGVGKSSLINNISPELSLLTGEISKKLGRGKHTTRYVELYYIGVLNAYVADTPGFGCVDMGKYDIIHKDDLQFYFREFQDYIGKCQFTGCSHTCEKGCAVLEALKENKITQERFDSYVELYNNAKLVKDWDKSHN